jgi:serine/threonine-protein kinase
MSQPSWIGYTLNGRYKIEELLGQGGMSAVYKGTDPNLKRVVAIKLIHPHLSGDPEFVRRFEVEAASIAQLRHPNIVQVYDFSHDGDTYYMVMEFVPGESLQDRLKRLIKANRRMSLAEVVKTGVEVCQAVDYAHQRGLIHRDIKPANVMLSVHGQAILMDFGIVKIIGEKHHTATGAVVGTALYMSPEQIRGLRPDHRVDIYSIGVMLYEMVSGRPPFEADSAMTIMMMHLNDPVPDLHELNPDVPEALKSVIEKALEKDPANRYQSAAELAADLQQALTPQPARPAAPLKTIVETPPPGRESRQAPGEAASQPAARPAQTAPKPAEAAPEPMAAPAAAKPALAGSPAAASMSRYLPMAVVGGGAVIVVLIVVLIINGLSSTRGGSPQATAGPSATRQSVAQVAATTAAPTPAPSQTPAPPSPTAEPSNTPPPTVVPTNTVPPGRYVRINGITIESGYYVVDYETFEYTEAVPGWHIHFFFNSVKPEQAGMPGNGPWYLYGGPRPFKGYAVSDRPAAATQLCALVADPYHAVTQNSGNCWNLPEY